MAHSRSAAMTRLATPFDYQAALDTPGWRETVAWPLSFAETFRVTRAATGAALGLIDRLDEEMLRPAALLGLGSVLALSRSLVENAFVAQAADASGMRILGGPPELAVLGGAARTEQSSGVNDPALFKPMSAPRGEALRRLARTASWTSPWRLPVAILTPEIVAVSHNDMLRDAARHAGTAVKYFQAEALLRAARVHPEAAPKALWGDLDDFAARLSKRLAHIEGLSSPYRARLAKLLESLIAPAHRKAVTDLAGLRRLRKLPRKLWSGSGGYYPARAVGIEVRRRGGNVTRFAHGWFAGMAGVTEGLVFSELAVSDRYVVETPIGAHCLTDASANGPMAICARAEITGNTGASALAALALDRPARANSRPQVIYAPTILRGQRQFLPPILPDVIYLDWQFRLVEALQNMPVNLMCKPHPEGLLRGKRHPLADIAPTSTQPFESHIAWADRFLFDYGQSTTFAEALCTDRPIIFIDMGNPIFNARVKDMIARRCHVISARFDGRNRPLVDSDALQEALCGGSEQVDSSEFRCLLMGAPE
jgi:hypothetical protein